MEHLTGVTPTHQRQLLLFGDAETPPPPPAEPLGTGRGRIEQLDGSWWIVDLRDVPNCGPYMTKAEAESDSPRMAFASSCSTYKKPLVVM